MTKYHLVPKYGRVNSILILELSEEQASKLDRCLQDPILLVKDIDYIDNKKD